jgi:hypothetical protein
MSFSLNVALSLDVALALSLNNVLSLYLNAALFLNAVPSVSPPSMLLCPWKNTCWQRWND